MRRHRRTHLAVAALAAAVALSACGVGSVDQGDVTAEAQRRGGGVTTALVDDALAAVAEATGVDHLEVHSVTAQLAAVTIVVPAGDGSVRREAWRYGTSGRYGGRGLEGPELAEDPGGELFALAAGDLDVDVVAETARAAGDPGAWVDSLTVVRPSSDAAPQAEVVVTAGGLPATVVVATDGTLVEGPLR